MTTTQDSYREFINEVKQCAAGLRGWVDCSKVRAAKLGLQHGTLTVAARALGLTVQRHGGRYSATRAA